MGSTVSAPVVTVGKVNKNAQKIYRHYNVPDHLHPYELRKETQDKFPDIELALALEAFGCLATRKLGLGDEISKMSAENLEKYKKIVNPAKALQSALLADPGTTSYEIEIKLEENQFHLCRNSLVELNDIVCKYTTLTIFHVCCNYLRYLPYGIGQLKSLKMLLLSRNRLTVIPDEIGECKELKEIDLSFNLIKSLPRSFASLKRLNTLQLANNLLEEIQPFIGKMNSLKYLNISNNKIKSIPLEIFKLPFLLSINCNGCCLDFTQKKFSVIGDLSLMETVTRNLIRKNLSIPRSMPKPAIDYILSVKECCFCGGPYFNYYVDVKDIHLFDSEFYPIHYKMCCLHYERHEERLSTLFKRSLATFPIKLFEENLPSITELFEPRSYEEEILHKIQQEALNAENFPLASLSKQNKNDYRQIDNFFADELDSYNIFDHIFNER